MFSQSRFLIVWVSLLTLLLGGILGLLQAWFGDYNPWPMFRWDLLVWLHFALAALVIFHWWFRPIPFLVAWLPLVFGLWSLFSAIPLPFFLSPIATQTVMSGVAILVAFFCMLLQYRAEAAGKRRRRLNRATTDISFVQAAWRVPLSFLLSALLLTIYGAYCLVAAAHHFTGNFVRFDREGVHTQVRIYTFENKRAYLVGMVHIGPDEYFRAALRALPAGPAFALMEGVSDHQGLLQGKTAHYDVLAETLGFATQSGFHSELMARYENEIADVDVSAFKESSQRILLEALGAKSDSQSLSRNFEASYSSQEFRDFWHDLIERRNLRALEVFDAKLPNHEVFVLPWGAAHMPGLVAGLAQRGFIEVGAERLTLITWRELLNDE